MPFQPQLFSLYTPFYPPSPLDTLAFTVVFDTVLSLLVAIALAVVAVVIVVAALLVLVKAVVVVGSRKYNVFTILESISCIKISFVLGAYNTIKIENKI